MVGWLVGWDEKGSLVGEPLLSTETVQRCEGQSPWDPLDPDNKTSEIQKIRRSNERNDVYEPHAVLMVTAGNEPLMTGSGRNAPGAFSTRGSPPGRGPGHRRVPAKRFLVFCSPPCGGDDTDPSLMGVRLQVNGLEHSRQERECGSGRKTSWTTG